MVLVGVSPERASHTDCHSHHGRSGMRAGDLGRVWRLYTECDTHLRRDELVWGGRGSGGQYACGRSGALFPSCAVEKLCVVMCICGGGSGMAESNQRMLLVAELACLLSQSTQQRRSRCMFRCRETPCILRAGVSSPVSGAFARPSSAAHSSGVLQEALPKAAKFCKISTRFGLCRAI